MQTYTNRYSIPNSGCNPKSLTRMVVLTLTYTDASGNTSANVMMSANDNATYSLDGMGGHLDGEYTGGHMHGGSIQGAVFYDGKEPKPHDDSLIVVDLVGVTIASVVNGSLKKGMKGTGTWRALAPAWLKVGTSKSLDWEVR